ncbi:hypothetical protein [Weissella cibaria]|uniref:hypothetical protein n=1 Tax=Weissella cibaria TaxID=137591 RepID=UPI0013DA8CDB|nr:hypothetical protein [Weissella cibaria]NFA03180.1 hypothetical protein [Weissella cibaria]
MNNDQIINFYQNNGFGHIDLANKREIRSLPSFGQFGLMTLRVFNQAGTPESDVIFQWDNLSSALAWAISLSDFIALIEQYNH